MQTLPAAHVPHAPTMQPFITAPLDELVVAALEALPLLALALLALALLALALLALALLALEPEPPAPDALVLEALVLEALVLEAFVLEALVLEAADVVDPLGGDAPAEVIAAEDVAVLVAPPALIPSPTPWTTDPHAPMFDEPATNDTATQDARSIARRDASLP